MKKTNFLLKWKNVRFVGMRKSRCSSSHVGTSIPARNVPLKFINVHCVESVLRNLYLHFFHNIEMVVCAMMRECKVSNAKAQSFTFNFEINLTLWVIFYIIYIYMYYVFFLQSIFYITFFLFDIFILYLKCHILDNSQILYSCLTWLFTVIVCYLTFVNHVILKCQ